MSRNVITPRWITALLIDIDYHISVSYWNKNQREWDSPLQNNGEEYINDTFELKSYDWNNENDQYNFKFGDFTIEWYKHVGRCSYMSREIDADEFIFMYEECLKSIEKDFGEYAL